MRSDFYLISFFVFFFWKSKKSYISLFDLLTHLYSTQEQTIVVNDAFLAKGVICMRKCKVCSYYKEPLRYIYILMSIIGSKFT